MREILPGGTKTITGPLASGALIETCIACLYGHQDIEKTPTMSRFIYELIVIGYWQLAYT